MKIGWLLGWAIPESWFAVFARESFPDAHHIFVKPNPDAIDRLESCGGLDWVVGYSLGSLLLLNHASRAERLGRVALLAPIFALPKERGRGGKAAAGEIRLVGRRLRNGWVQTVLDFYRLAGLSARPAGERSQTSPGLRAQIALCRETAALQRLGATLEFPGWLPGEAGDIADGSSELASDDLPWGIEQLLTLNVEPPLPESWSGWCGTQDALLDAERLSRLDRKIVPVEGVTHHPRALIEAFAGSLGKSTRRISP